MDLEQAVAGVTYEFAIKDWESPTGEILPGETKRRRFIGRKDIDGTLFVEVANASGKRHLIAVETINGILPGTA